MQPNPGQTYTTKEGDTPARIAGQAYGDPAKANLIQEANDTQTPLNSTSVLPTGMSLLIPFNVEAESTKKRLLRRGLGNTESIQG